jgi:hypothetical protein
MSFNKKEWLKDEMKKPGREWIKNASYLKMEFCDIRLKDGTEIGPCWPNGYTFIDITSGDAETKYDLADVDCFRFYEEDDSEEEDPEDEGEDGDEQEL